MQAPLGVVGVPSPGLGVAARPPHWTRGSLQAGACLIKVIPDILAVSGAEPIFLPSPSLCPFPSCHLPPSQPLLSLCSGASRFPGKEGC